MIAGQFIAGKSARLANLYARKILGIVLNEVSGQDVWYFLDFSPPQMEGAELEGSFMRGFTLSTLNLSKSNKYHGKMMTPRQTLQVNAVQRRRQPGCC